MASSCGIGSFPISESDSSCSLLREMYERRPLGLQKELRMRLKTRVFAMYGIVYDFDIGSGLRPALVTTSHRLSYDSESRTWLPAGQDPDR